METEASWLVHLSSGKLCWYHYEYTNVNVAKTHTWEDSCGRRFTFSFAVRKLNGSNTIELKTKFEKVWTLHRPKIMSLELEDLALKWSYSVKLQLFYNDVVITSCSGSWKGRFAETSESSDNGYDSISNPVVTIEAIRLDEMYTMTKEGDVVRLELAFKFRVDEGVVCEPQVGGLSLDVGPCSRHILDKLPRDVKIICGQEEFRAHKIILSCCSEVFMRMFESELRESADGCVVIEDFEPDTVKDLISFLYDGTPEATTKESLVALLDCAEKYEINALKSTVLKKMISSLNAENAAEFAAASLKYRADEKIKSALFNYCKANFARLTTSEEFKQFFKDNVNLFL